MLYNKSYKELKYEIFYSMSQVKLDSRIGELPQKVVLTISHFNTLEIEISFVLFKSVSLLFKIC